MPLNIDFFTSDQCLYIRTTSEKTKKEEKNNFDHTETRRASSITELALLIFEHIVFDLRKWIALEIDIAQEADIRH